MRIGMVVGYLALVSAISAAIYYVPDYYWLETATAYHSALALRMAQINAVAWSDNHRAFLNEFEIARDCTGIQVVAVFSGILLPMTRCRWRKKLLAIGTVALSVYLLNVLRIILEVWLLYSGLLPWSLVHYPLGLVLGIVSVFMLVLGLNRFVNEFGGFIGSLINHNPAR